MEATLKELAKLEKLASNSSSFKGKSPCIADSLDSLLQSLREAKESVQCGTADDEVLNVLSRRVDSAKKDVDERQKEVYNSLARFGKALDKVCCLTNLARIPHSYDAYVAIYYSATIVSTAILVSGSHCSVGKDHRAPFPAHRPVRDGRDISQCM